MGHSTSKLQQHELTRSSSLPHPLLPSSTHHQHRQPATYSHAPPAAPVVNDDPFSPPPASAKSFSAMGYGPSPAHSSIWFPAPENGLTSEARRYRDEVLEGMRRDEERERLSKRGWLGGIDGKGARSQAQTMGVAVSKRMSVGKWKDGMVGSVMGRGRSWRGSLRRGELSGGGGSRRSKRGSRELDEVVGSGYYLERKRRDVELDLAAAGTGGGQLDGLPEGLRPGNGNDATTSPIKPRRPYSEALTPSTTSSNDPTRRLSSPNLTRNSPRPHPHLSSLPPAFVHHPSTLLPGKPTQHLAAPFHAVISLNTPCSETMDSPFLPPLSPALEQHEVEDENPNDWSPLSPTRLAKLLHPLSLRPGGSSASSRTSSAAPASPNSLSATAGKEIGVVGKCFAGRRGEVNDEGGMESRNRTSTLGLSLSVSEQARLSLPPPPSPLADGILGEVVVRRVSTPLYSPLTENGPPSPDNLDPSPSPPAQAFSPIIPPPPHPTPVILQGLDLLGAEAGGPPLISESAFTSNFPPHPPLPRDSTSTSPYHLPPNISISIQCDTLIRELTSPERIPLPSSPLTTPSSSLATALAGAPQIYAAPHLPSPILPNSNSNFSPPTSPLARRRVLQPTDAHDGQQEGVGGGDVSFQTPPLLPVQRVSSTDSSTASSTLQDSSQTPTTSSESVVLPPPPPPPAFKRPSKSKHRGAGNNPPRTRSSLLLVVKERLDLLSSSSPPLDAQSSQDTLNSTSSPPAGGILGRSKGSIRRSSRFLSSSANLKLGSPSLDTPSTPTVEVGIPIGTGAGFGGVGVEGGGSARHSSKRVSGGDWGVLMSAARVEEQRGGKLGEGKEAVEGRILKWRRESSLFE